MPEALPSIQTQLPERLIQLVPRFRPDVDGLGEFALCLGDALWQAYAIPSDYVVWQKQRPEPALPPLAPVAESYRLHRVTSGRRGELEEILRRLGAEISHPVLLVHYTSYAYSTEGIAWWLPALLRRFIERGGRVVGFFHELYAYGKFPNKTWMTSGLQRHIFREMLALSQVAITSNAAYVDWIQRHNRAGRPIILAGVSSNVGELQAATPLALRSRRLAIFGQYPVRRSLYEEHMPRLLQLVSHLGVTEVADIGTTPADRATLDKAAEQFSGRLRVYGPLPATQVGQLLADSQAGALNYNYSVRFKSGVVGAYQAHALPAIIFPQAGQPGPTELDPGCPTPDQVLGTPPGDLPAMLQQAALAGFDYYQEHRSYAAVLRQLLPALRQP